MNKMSSSGRHVCLYIHSIIQSWLTVQCIKLTQMQVDTFRLCSHQIWKNIDMYPNIRVFQELKYLDIFFILCTQQSIEFSQNGIKSKTLSVPNKVDSKCSYLLLSVSQLTNARSKSKTEGKELIIHLIKIIWSAC